MTPRIFLVEDSDTDRDMIEKVLQKKGFEVDSFVSGLEMLAKLDAIAPDLILLDIVMPDALGTEILKLVRQRKSRIEIPVILITIKADAPDVVESLSLGANDYIVKPLNFDVTLMRISTQLQIVQLTQSLTRIKEMEMAAVMTATYNHELNNPLAIAVGSLEAYRLGGDRRNLDRMEKALHRMANIVKHSNRSIQDKIDWETYLSATKKIR